MKDRDANDDLFTASLTERETQESYNPYWAIVPGLIGGPVATTISMVLVARRLRVSRGAIAVIVAAGTVALALAAVAPAYADVSNAAAFRLGAIVAFAAQLPLVVRRFRSWQLRGRDAASFLGVGVLAAIVGMAVDLVIGVSLGRV